MGLPTIQSRGPVTDEDDGELDLDGSHYSEALHRFGQVILADVTHSDCYCGEDRGGIMNRTSYQNGEDGERDLEDGRQLE